MDCGKVQIEQLQLDPVVTDEHINPLSFNHVNYFRGAVEATRQAHQLILTLIKDPDCDINDHLPRARQSHHNPASHRSSFEIPSASNHSTAQETSRISHLPTTSPNTSSNPVTIPVSRDTTQGHRPAITAVSSSHLPGNARWASPTYQAPTKVTSVSENPLKQQSTATQSSSGRSPAARQLVFSSTSPPPLAQTTRVTSSSRVISSTTQITSSATRVTSSKTGVVSSAPRSTTSANRGTTSKTSVTSSTTRVVSSSEYRSSKQLSYSNVAGGVVPENGESTKAESSDDGLNVTSLPPVISSILSQVCENRRPIVWNKGYYPKSVSEAADLMKKIEESGQLSQPLSVATSGGVFKPLPQDTSPPNPSSTSPASSSSPVVNSTPSPPDAMGASVEEKPIQPIGTERAHRRTNTSPSPTLTGMPPLISAGTCFVFTGPKCLHTVAVCVKHILFMFCRRNWWNYQ